MERTNPKNAGMGTFFPESKAPVPKPSLLSVVPPPLGTQQRGDPFPGSPLPPPGCSPCGASLGLGTAVGELGANGCLESS